MNPYVVDVAYRATHEVELPVSELRTLEQGAVDLVAAFVAQIMLLKRKINCQDAYIEQLEERLRAHGELLNDDEMDDARAKVAAAIEAKEQKEVA